MTITPHLFPPLQFRNRRVNTYPEHIETVKKLRKLLRPTRLLHNVLNQEVKARAREAGNRLMKIVEIGFSPVKARRLNEGSKTQRRLAGQKHSSVTEARELSEASEQMSISPELEVPFSRMMRPLVRTTGCSLQAKCFFDDLKASSPLDLGEL